MTWTCTACGRLGVGREGVLGVRAHRARPGNLERWSSVHPDCFDSAGMTYGISFADVDVRGREWWVRHVGDKAWASFTDLEGALARVTRGEGSRGPDGLTVTA